MFFFFSFLLYAVCRCCVPVSHRQLLTLWQPRYGITAVAVLHSFCDSYERCFCVCACVSIMWVYHPEHNNEGNFQPTLPLNFTSARAVQQRRNSSSSGTTPLNLATLLYAGAPVCFSFSTCDPRDSKSTTSRNLVYDIIYQYQY